MTANRNIDGGSFSRFHYSFFVTNLSRARDFYVRCLGCTEGRSAPTWVDMDFFGHELSLHLGTPVATTNKGEVDGIKVPMPHFGVALGLDEWTAAVERMTANKVDFVVSPRTRFEGKVGEQRTAFVLDPDGNAIELKGFRSMDQLFQSAR